MNEKSRICSRRWMEKSVRKESECRRRWFYECAIVDHKAQPIESILELALPHTYTQPHAEIMSKNNKLNTFRALVFHMVSVEQTNKTLSALGVCARLFFFAAVSFYLSVLLCVCFFHINVVVKRFFTKTIKKTSENQLNGSFTSFIRYISRMNVFLLLFDPARIDIVKSNSMWCN